MEQKEEKKKENPKGTIIQTAACPFCGQVRIREGAATKIREEALEEFARLNCDCEGARAYQKKHLRLKKAKDQILSWFGEEESEFTKKAMEIIRMVQEYEMDSATLVSNDGVKFKVSISNKGNLKIGISRTRTDTKEIS